MFRKLKGLFSKKVDYKLIKKLLGSELTIRNGHGYGFVSDEKLYNNQYLEIGFGYIRSGYGDWGLGATHSATSPLKVVIDKDFNIIDKETDSFYNSKDVQEVVDNSKKLLNKLGDKLELDNEVLENIIKRLFKVHQSGKCFGINLIDTDDWDCIERMTVSAEADYKGE